MKRTASPLSETARKAVTDALVSGVIDALDLYTQTKVAHWNLRGPHFASLHPLFDSFAGELLGFVDEMAERVVALGGEVRTTARVVASKSSLQEYPNVERDLDHAKALADRFTAFVHGLHRARSVADANEDGDTADLLTEIISAFEKHAWFLIATVDG